MKKKEKEKTNWNYIRFSGYKPSNAVIRTLAEVKTRAHFQLSHKPKYRLLGREVRRGHLSESAYSRLSWSKLANRFRRLFRYAGLQHCYHTSYFSYF